MLDNMKTLISLCKRRGFVFQSSEVYGGINACYDYGPIGVYLKNNVKKLWWDSMTSRIDIVGLDSAILMHPTVWKASGHIDGFSDPLVQCKGCKARHRLDNMSDHKKCPTCGSSDLTEPRDFNLMFRTFMGPLEEQEIYLRPETAQGIYVNFENVRTTMRLKVPFGIAQIGKAFRNEITPENFIFRTREFEQMEMQYFVEPGNDEKSFENWKNIRMDFYKALGLELRFKEHSPDELAHYAKSAGDIEYKFPFGWHELEGIHNRTDYDLKKHQEFSKKSFSYFKDQDTKFVPYVVETSVGCDRLVLAILCSAYFEEKLSDDIRVVMKFPFDIAPIKVAVLPLSKKPGLIEVAQNIYKELSESFSTQYDDTGSIGKRYRRQDEIGTPFCVTVDFDTLNDKMVTVRNRDTMTQDRVPATQISKMLK